MYTHYSVRSYATKEARDRKARGVLDYAQSGADA